MKKSPLEERIRAEILADPNFQAKKEAHEKKMGLLMSRLEEGQVLTYEDQYYYCEGLTWESIFSQPLCEDVFYFRAYMSRGDNDFGSLKVNYTKENENRFERMVFDWNILIKNSGSSDPYILAEKEELEKELEILNRQKGKIVSINDKDYFDAIAWSKFRFLRVRKNFRLDIKGDYYSLWLNGEEILFDFKACTHILARHFAHGKKTYKADQDHFYNVFDPFHLHSDLEIFFKAIDQSGLYIKDSIQNITIRKNGQLYKIITRDHKYGSFTKKRIVTFYPLSKVSALSNLSRNYKEQKVIDDLWVFVKSSG